MLLLHESLSMEAQLIAYMKRTHNYPTKLPALPNSIMVVGSGCVAASRVTIKNKSIINNNLEEALCKLTYL